MKPTIPPSPLGSALEALRYADRFDFPLTLAELHHQLPSPGPVALEDLARSIQGRPEVRRSGGLYFLPGREEIVALRAARRDKAARLFARVRGFVSALARVPWVEGIFLSGGNAFENPADDDVDFFLVCRPGTCWATLLAAKVLGQRLGVRRTICPNYVLSSGRMGLPEETAFTAYQLIHLKPLFGAGALRRLWDANAWVGRFFPNARFRPEAPFSVPERPRPASAWAGRALEPLAALLCRSYLRLRLGMKPDPPRVILGPGRLKLHSKDHSED